MIDEVAVGVRGGRAEGGLGAVLPPPPLAYLHALGHLNSVMQSQQAPPPPPASAYLLALGPLDGIVHHLLHELHVHLISGRQPLGHGCTEPDDWQHSTAQPAGGRKYSQQRGKKYSQQQSVDFTVWIQQQYSLLKSWQYSLLKGWQYSLLKGWQFNLLKGWQYSLLKGSTVRYTEKYCWEQQCQQATPPLLPLLHNVIELALVVTITVEKILKQYLHQTNKKTIWCGQQQPGIRRSQLSTAWISYSQGSTWASYSQESLGSVAGISKDELAGEGDGS